MPTLLLGQMRAAKKGLPHQPPEGTGYQGVEGEQALVRIGLPLPLRLVAADLVVDLAKGALVGSADDVGQGKALIAVLDLDHGRHIYLIKEDQLVAPVAKACM